ncbi:GNAT family N-acetyltransferase [Rugosimonospora acidiphila]|uniref:GNAT family N-acetyltransferase n=1 Tax=Rugosimonospora acidiphila TaxID=556531 RepID=A0ABP9SIJ1_9ACTN
MSGDNPALRPADVELRRAGTPDAGAVAEVWLRSYRAALPTVRRAHSEDEVRAWVRDVLVPEHETWVAVAFSAVASSAVASSGAGSVVVGMMALDDGWVDQLYLDPSWRGRGIGERLLDLAKRRHPGGLRLWTFQVNAAACRFYERHGFVAVERTDGAGNEEREPDVRYEWRPAR